uniref:Histone-lysine N-methyltransferase eggless n=1 Tax=Diabrotica virgifera virgifera TaxID=50390 RepID=A0A6P7FBF2_DIAVI
MEVSENDQDDCMEIDDSIPETSIIERKSDQFDSSEGDTSTVEKEKSDSNEKMEESSEDKTNADVNTDLTTVTTEQPADKSAENVDRPSESADKSTENTDKPAEIADKSAENVEKSAEHTDKPAETTDKSAENRDKPSESADKSAENTDKPAESADKSAENVDKSAENTDKPAESADTSVENTDKPAENTDKPAENADKSAEKTDKPNTSENQKQAPRPPPRDDGEIVILDDDDDDDMQQDTNNVIAIDDIIDLVDKPINLRCINNNCDGSHADFILAPDFCLSYYRVKRSKSKKEELCLGCYDKAVSNFDELTTNLKESKLILKCSYPVMNETLQISDSDEEEEEEKENVNWNQKNVKFIRTHFFDVINKTVGKLNGEEIINMETAYVKFESNQLEVNQKEVSRKASELRKFFDKIQLNLYNQFRPELSPLKALSITDDFNISSSLLVRTEQSMEMSPRKSSRSHKPVSYVELDDPGNSNSPKVTMSPEVEMPKDLPPVGPVVEIEPKIGEIYYIVRENFQTSWIRARLQTKIPAGVPHNGKVYPTTLYKLVELKQQKERLINGKYIAQLHHSRERLLIVGTRVISVFRESSTDEMKKSRTDPYYAGIVAEQPFEGNKYRYLIFFDIGYSQYVSFLNVNRVIETSPNVWDDVDEGCRVFIKKYLESQDRPMVKLIKDQTIKVEYNGKWLICRVIDVDCSLAQVSFETIKRTEWIYRGSTRLSPMFMEEQAATSRHTGVRITRKLGPNESATVVQYTRKDENNSSVQPTTENSVEAPPPIRAVARKSTTRPQNTTATAKPFLPEDVRNTNNTNGPTSKIMYFTPRDQVIIKRKYKLHTCSHKCRELQTYDSTKLRGHNPLSKPLLCGWGRLTVKSRGRREIIYKSPCARLLRNIAEVHTYLRVTRSELTIDLFDFHHNVRCLAEFNVDCPPDPADLSKGMEQTPIPVVNGINREMLDFCNYSIKRVPMEGVDMNLDPDYLCGCDCDDDCIDKTKCACWKLTLEGAKYTGKDVNPTSVGYIYRRLPEQVITGIYECNSRCKCSSTCLNRVVQNPMSLKLQVFRTHNRGWGIRCLNDVPPGSFICIYAGTIHTEAMANVDGVAFGDEYFAELDYIETVEKYKEDYEAEVMEEEEEQNKNKRRKEPEEEEEEEEESVAVISNSKYKRYNYAADNDFTPSHPDRIVAGDAPIRTRLRKRNKDDAKDEENEVKGKKEDSRNEMMKIKQEISNKNNSESNQSMKALIEGLSDNIETVTISDEEDEGREVLSFNPQASNLDDKAPNYTSVRDLYGKDESVYVMDAKNAGNIGRFLNHSCSPNVFVQNVFVDTHDPRFPWVSFFSLHHIRAGTELTWNYNYDIGSVPGKMLTCHCASGECKGRLL